LSGKIRNRLFVTSLKSKGQYINLVKITAKYQLDIVTFYLYCSFAEWDI